MTAPQIEKRVREIIQKRLEDKEYCTGQERRDLQDLSQAHWIKAFANDLHGLNEALIRGRSVFAVCTKEPRNLDSGSHYFDVFYTDAKGQVSKFWPGPTLYRFVGQVRQDRDHSMSRFIFRSGAIGMSRLLDATDSLFNFLKGITGTYAQIS